MIFFEDWLKLIGKLLILISIGVQAYVLSAESNLRNKQVEYQAKKDHYSHFIDLVKNKDISNIIFDKAVEIHQKRLERVEIKWKRKSKIRRDEIKRLGNISFWALLIFGFGTFILTFGEYLTFRKNRLKTSL